jgi:short-subunit dehydrogenase
MTANSPGVAMITGASAGMGPVYADRLARRQG